MLAVAALVPGWSIRLVAKIGVLAMSRVDSSNDRTDGQFRRPLINGFPAQVAQDPRQRKFRSLAVRHTPLRDVCQCLHDD